MSAKKVRGRRSFVLVFGEGREKHDQDAICAIASTIQARVCVSSQVPTFTARGRPLTLARNANPAKQQKLLAKINQICEAWTRGDVTAVIMHHDSDTPDPRLENRTALLRILQEEGLPQPVAAVPVVDIECWWQSFPDELKRVSVRWRNLAIPGGRTDTGHHGKSQLKAITRQAGQEYDEADSLKVAGYIAERIDSDGPTAPGGKNASWDRFVADVAAIRQ